MSISFLWNITKITKIGNKVTKQAASLYGSSAITPDVLKAKLIIPNEIFGKLYEEISGVEGVTLEYIPSWKDIIEDVGKRFPKVEDILNLLKEKREQDKIMNTTLSGPHRDRIIYMRNGKPFINYASTGQCRLISLLLRVSQAVYYTRITNSKPVLLMDDVLLELDPEKRQKLTSMLPEYDQLFCTFLPGEPYENYKRSTTRIYKIKDGEWYE